MVLVRIILAAVVLSSAAREVIAENHAVDFERLRREHWAYQPLKKVEPRATADTSWPRTDIDRFIIAKLASRGLKPVADADPAVLVRRLYFDLIGLPPTPEQIDAFVNDPSPAAWERLVDGLLASPQFGERWGRHWLDVVRFGESLTLRGFVLPDTWRFRDYIIEAFNQDRPFSQLMQEHVAGDLMPAESVPQRRRQMTGTTFLAMGNTNLEEQDKKQLRMDVVDEQLDTIGRAFLGQTIGCARCHDHKFDPISTAEYYAMAGILRNAKAMEHANVSKWIQVPLPEEPEVEAKLVQHEQAVAALQARITDARTALAKAKTSGADKLPAGGKPSVIALKDLPGIVIDDSAARRVGEWTHSTHVATYIGDGYLHDGDAAKGERSLTFQPQIPRSGRYEVRLSYMPSTNRATNVPVTILSEDGERTVTVNQQEPPLIDGRFVSLGVFAFQKDGQAYVLISNEGTDGHVIADAVQFLPEGGDVASPSSVSREPKSPEQKKIEVEIKRLSKELKQLTESGPKRQMIVSVVEEPEIGDTQVHVRGVPHTLGATVPRGFLGCVPVSSPPAIPPNQSGRLQLAQWLAHPENPLPPRVMANRVWHWLMGQGLVRTVDNFGATGEMPSHPELLDYLAREFATDHWSVKRLVRRIVLSRTYQLSTASDSAVVEADPENRLRWRMDRRRLEAECLRDAMLFVSGRLDVTAGGPGYEPGLEFDYNFVHTNTRRSVYVPVFRNALPDVFEAFDFADPSTIVGDRNASTVAQQALFLMNHPFPREQATAAAERLLAQSNLTDEARLTRACRMIFGRDATPQERAILHEFLAGSAKSSPEERREVWAQVIHSLFASTDFRYLN